MPLSLSYYKMSYRDDIYSVFDIRIAQKNIRIMHLYDNIKEECSKFLSQFSKPDIIISSTSEEIDQYMRRSIVAPIPELHNNDTNIAITFDYGYYETLLICEKISDALIEFGILMVHGAAIDIYGKSFIFSAPSGVGKTTHILNWQKIYPNVSIINGDKPFVDVQNKTVYGSPWCGKEKIGENATAYLSGIILLERGLLNIIKPIQFADAMSRFVQQIHVPKDHSMALKAYRYFYEFKKIPFYHLTCTKDVQSAVIAYEGLGIERLI